MQPTLQPYQVVWSTRDFKKLERGDLVVFDHEGETMVKRVAGLPGDRVDQYLIAGDWMVPDYPVWNRFAAKNGYPKRTTIVPEGSVYVVGDSIEKSIDSRSYGPIKISSIGAKLLYQESESPKLPSLRLSRNLTVQRNEPAGA
ncbi:signal peptidase I [Fimbriimonas ginsengisoli Gsoil 348]|uniref:Signal peptidase I n=2 Tax=Fimbriimonas ginsengisoli TaxID=1005039 RepID=A0A068NJP7_FIMGI|nr:signal peptidase I [Fimbriimonas ginsengisoli Gsoil 348]